VYLWLLRTKRMANPDPVIHTQSRFGGLFGRDGTFVSHVEAGRRTMPHDLRDRWFQLIGLDTVELQDYLTRVDPRSHSPLWSANPEQASSHADFDLLDQALEGEFLTPEQWARACNAAATLQLPRTVRRFCRRAADAMGVTISGGHRVIGSAMLQLPEPIVADSVRESIESAPTRGYHAIEALAALDGPLSGPVLRDFFRYIPDPWLERTLAESMRRLVSRGEVTTLSDDPTGLQHSLVDGLEEVASWSARVELANLAWALGPMPGHLQKRLAEDANADVRLVANPKPGASAQAAVLALREQAVAPTLDKMYGSPVEDPLANRLVGAMMVGRTLRSRILAAKALGLSPYSARVTAVLVSLTTDPAIEVRREAARALQCFPTTTDVVASLTTTALGDPDPDLRSCAMWSLIFHRDVLTQQVLDACLQDPDPTVRRRAVELAAAAGHTMAVRTATADPDPAVARNAQLLGTRHG
jgi:HEAT repeat protein